MDDILPLAIFQRFTYIYAESDNIRENSIVKRVGGEPLPVPEEAGDKLGKIILKACAYEPKDRYRKPEQMRMDLEAELLAFRERPLVVFSTVRAIPKSPSL